MALGESQDWSWTARGWELMSLFVCFLYASKAAPKIDSKSVEGIATERTWDMVLQDEGDCA